MSNQQQIILRVLDAVTYVEGRIDSPTYRGLKKALGYEDENAIWRTKKLKEKLESEGKDTSWLEKHDGVMSTVCYNRKSCKCAIKKDGTHFPTGLLGKAREYLNDCNVSVQLINQRSPAVRSSGYAMTEDFESRDYQKKIIDDSCNRERGIIKIATGGGKTSVASAIIANLAATPTIFYVTSIDLLKQAKSELERFIKKDGKPLEVGTIGGGKFDPKDVTVMTVQTAVKSLGFKFAKYDEEDDTDATKLSVEQKKQTVDLIHSCKNMVCDECITGDSIVITRKFGPKRIDEISSLIGEEILSFNDTSVVWEKITDYFDQGTKEVLDILLDSGKTIQCTENHPIMTKRGWIEAGKLKQTDQVLSLVDAVAGCKSRLETEVQADTRSLYSVTKSIEEMPPNGRHCSIALSSMHRDANADAGIRCSCNMLPWNRLLSIEGPHSIENTSTVTIKDQMYGDCVYLMQNCRQYMEHCWGTDLLCSQAIEAEIPDCKSTTVSCKKNGHCINANSCTTCHQKLGYITMEAMEKKLFLFIHRACLACRAFIKFVILMGKKKSTRHGSTRLEKLDWHGGYATMDRGLIIVCEFILRVFLNMKSRFARNGLIPNMDQPVFTLAKTNTLSYRHLKKQEKISFKPLISMSQNVCATKYESIRSIRSMGKKRVYDITVKNTHCFFANGILVHNCQHWAAKTCQTISDHSYSARYRFAFSATPWRDMGDDMLIDACFGKCIADINASFLIERGYLIQPTIYFVHTRFQTPMESYPNVYQEGIVENKERNLMISHIAKKMVESGRQILILVRIKDHGKCLEAMIPNSFFIHGSHSGEKRLQHLELMRQRKADVTISTSIFDEGVDVKPLDGLILAGSGKSQTRALQRVGRVLRPFTDNASGYIKKDAFVVDFYDVMKFMKAHSSKRRSIYETEPKFIIKDWK